MQRMGMCLRLKPGTVEEYKRLHAAVWPGVLARITASNIRNYTIFLRRPELLLFATWEYHGADWAADVARMQADAPTRRWWALTDPCQEPLPTHAAGEWWAAMDEVFHTD